MALTRWTFVSRVMSLLFNMLSRLVIAFLPRSMHLDFMAAVSSAVILEPKKNSLAISIVSPSICCMGNSYGNICHDLRFLNVEF